MIQVGGHVSLLRHGRRAKLDLCRFCASPMIRAPPRPATLVHKSYAAQATQPYPEGRSLPARTPLAAARTPHPRGHHASHHPAARPPASHLPFRLVEVLVRAPLSGLCATSLSSAFRRALAYLTTSTFSEAPSNLTRAPVCVSLPFASDQCSFDTENLPCSYAYVVPSSVYRSKSPSAPG